jgi:hypothetical protein
MVLGITAEHLVPPPVSEGVPTFDWSLYFISKNIDCFPEEGVVGSVKNVLHFHDEEISF